MILTDLAGGARERELQSRMLGNFTFSLPGPGKLPVDCECSHLKTSFSTFFPFSFWFPFPSYCGPAFSVWRSCRQWVSYSPDLSRALSISCHSIKYPVRLSYSTALGKRYLHRQQLIMVLQGGVALPTLKRTYWIALKRLQVIEPLRVEWMCLIVPSGNQPCFGWRKPPAHAQGFQQCFGSNVWTGIVDGPPRLTGHT